MKPVATIQIATDNTAQFIEESDTKIRMALEILGLKAEKYAKAICPVGTPESTGIKGYMGGTLRNSITHKVYTGEKAVAIGTDVEYAPHVEFGTMYMRKKPYLKPAVEDHISEYKHIVEMMLK